MIEPQEPSIDAELDHFMLQDFNHLRGDDPSWKEAEVHISSTGRIADAVRHVISRRSETSQDAEVEPPLIADDGTAVSQILLRNDTEEGTEIASFGWKERAKVLTAGAGTLAVGVVVMGIRIKGWGDKK
jgi:hypothetical protein